MNGMTKTLLTVAITLASLHVAAESINGWPVRQDKQLDKALAQLEQEINNNTYKKINSVIIVHSGDLVYERYYNSSTRDDTHNPRSVGKTFVTPMLGLAIANGYIDGLDQPLGDFYNLKSHQNHSPKKELVTLRHLVSMSSGFEGYDFVAESVGNEENMYPESDWVKWALDLPMSESRSPGEEWRYFTAGIVVLGDILNQRLPGGLEVYAHKHFFEPLGISNYQWQHTPQRVANTAGGIQLTPLGFAKFGELHRLDGMWGDRRILPAGWAKDSITPVIDTLVDGVKYGRLWWSRSYAVDNEHWQTAYCSGNGGNKIFVFPAQELVIVVTASAYGQRYAHAQVDTMMNQHILPAIAAMDATSTTSSR